MMWFTFFEPAVPLVLRLSSLAPNIHKNVCSVLDCLFLYDTPNKPVFLTPVVAPPLPFDFLAIAFCILVDVEV